MWLRNFMEQELAKKFIFLNEYWEGTGEIVALLARSGLITSRSDKMTMEDYSAEISSDLNITDDGRFHVVCMEALHKLLVHYCVQYSLPNLLDLYLDHHKLVLDNDSLGSLQEAAVSFLMPTESNYSLCGIFSESLLMYSCAFIWVLCTFYSLLLIGS
jgi:spatacsin